MSDHATMDLPALLPIAYARQTVIPQSVAAGAADVLLADEVGQPVTLTPQFSADLGVCCVLDFGREVVGRVSLVATATGPARLTLFYGETLDEALRREDFTCGWYHHPRDTFRLVPGRNQLTVRDRRALRYLQIWIEEGPGAVTVSDAAVLHTHADVGEGGSFECSDPVVNRIWTVARETTLLCMQDWFEDGIKRDRLLWGDASYQLSCSLPLFGDSPTARNSIVYLARGQRDDGAIPSCAIRGIGLTPETFEPDYMPTLAEPDSFCSTWVGYNQAAMVLRMLWEHFLWTGDVTFARGLFPAASRLIHHLAGLEPEKLLPYHNFITDVPAVASDWWSSHGTVAAQIIRGLGYGRMLAHALGDRTVADLLAREIPRHAERFREQFLDRAAGLYADELDHATHSYHVQSHASLAGIPGAGTPAELLERVRGSGERMIPICGGAQFDWIEALFEGGLNVTGVEEIRRYGEPQIARGQTTFMDLFDPRNPDGPLPAGHAVSYCHGWSAGAAYFLPFHVAGVQPASPGCGALRIEPRPGGLDWVKASIPVPQGTVRIEYEVGSDGTPAGEVRLPHGCTATLANGVQISVAEG